MTPTLHVLPRGLLELRARRVDGQSREPLYALISRDESARPSWELTLSATAVRGLLQLLADGQACVNVSQVRLQIYADAQLERSVRTWAIRELDRLGEERESLNTPLPPPHAIHTVPAHLL